MFDFFRSTLHPEAYHGRSDPPPFFEGWYFKLVSAGERHRYAIIPGVFKGQDESVSHCFVQVLDGSTGQSNYHTYPYNQFWSSIGHFDIRIGPNRFISDRIQLDIRRPEQTLTGDLHFSNLSPWPVTLASPGIMGWYAWVPRMECYHGIVSLDHSIQGELKVDGQIADFSGGRGYIEKDWGKSFPAAWVWFQSNHFEIPGVCITASVAIIPWVGRAFPGFIVGFWYGGVLYRFATYSGAKIVKLEVGERQVTWIIAHRSLQLEIQAARTEGGLLKAPTPTGMDRRISETLNAQVFVRLTRLENGKRAEIFSGTGRHAGLEASGNLDRLLAMLHQPGSTSVGASRARTRQKE